MLVDLFITFLDICLWCACRFKKDGNPLVDLSPSSPIPTVHDFCADLDYNSDGCHVVSSVLKSL